MGNRTGWWVTSAAALALCVALAARADEALHGTWSAPVASDTYNVVFDEHGGMSVIRANEPVVVAQYDAGNGELDVTDLAGEEACGGDAAEARYEYSLENGLLRLSAADEPCANRARYLDGQEYTRKADLQDEPPGDPVS